MEGKTSIVTKAKDVIQTAKKYWNVPPKGKNIPYKEVAALSGAGFGVHWTTILASTIGLSASNFLVGASIGLRPMDLQIMLTVANAIYLFIMASTWDFSFMFLLPSPGKSTIFNPVSFITSFEKYF